VVELGTRVMARAVTAEISEFFSVAAHRRRHGQFHLGVQVTSIESDGSKVHRRQPERTAGTCLPT